MIELKVDPMLRRLQEKLEQKELSSFEAYALEIQLAAMEYKEVCVNVRTGWEYIVTLLRQFIITQFILIISVSIFINEQLFIALITKCDDCTMRGLSFTAVVLMVFAALFSLFVCFQSNRLFDNSQEFVERARALEEKYSVGIRTVTENTDNQAMPTFTYMEDRLRNPPFTTLMKTVLFRGYLSTCAIWFIILAFYLVPPLRSLIF